MIIYDYEPIHIIVSSLISVKEKDVLKKAWQSRLWQLIQKKKHNQWIPLSRRLNIRLRKVIR